MLEDCKHLLKPEMIDLVSFDCKLRIETETTRTVRTKVTQNGVYVSKGYSRVVYKGFGSDNHISCNNLRSRAIELHACGTIAVCVAIETQTTMEKSINHVFKFQT